MADDLTQILLGGLMRQRSGSFWSPMVTRPDPNAPAPELPSPGPVGMPPLPESATMPASEMVDDIQRDQAKRQYLQALLEYANAAAEPAPEPSWIAPNYSRNKIATHQENVSGKAEKANALAKILGVLSPPAPEQPKYQEVGGSLLHLNAQGGPRSVYDAPVKPAAPMAPTRPMNVGGGVIYKPDTNEWLQPPKDMRGATQDSEGGLPPASVYGRALDANVNPVPPDHPLHPLFQRVMAGMASKEEVAIAKEARSQWARAFQDSLQEAGKMKFGGAFSEEDYKQAEAHANRVLQQYLGGAAGGRTGAGTGQPQVSPQERFQQLKQQYPNLSDDDLEEMLVDEGYGG